AQLHCTPRVVNIAKAAVAGGSTQGDLAHITDSAFLESGFFVAMRTESALAAMAGDMVRLRNPFVRVAFNAHMLSAISATTEGGAKPLRRWQFGQETTTVTKAGVLLVLTDELLLQPASAAQ